MKFYAAGILACALLVSFAAAQSATAQSANGQPGSDTSGQATNPPIPVPPVPFATSRANTTGTYIAGNWTYPDPDESDAAYPPEALAAKIEGHVILDCQVAATGELRACDVITENPPGHGFGSATVALFLRAAHVDPASVPGGIPAGARKKFAYAWLLG